MPDGSLQYRIRTFPLPEEKGLPVSICLFPEKHHTHQRQKRPHHNRPERRGDDIIRWALRILWQVVYLWLLQQEEEGVQAAVEYVIVHAVETRLAHPTLVQDTQPLPG